MRTVVVDGVTMVYADSCPYCDGKLKEMDTGFGGMDGMTCTRCQVIWRKDGTVFYNKGFEEVEVPGGCLLVRPEVEE